MVYFIFKREYLSKTTQDTTIIKFNEFVSIVLKVYRGINLIIFNMYNIV